MASFTPGERRGLIVLAGMLALLAAVLGIRELRWNGAGASADDISPAGISSIVVADDSAAASAPGASALPQDTVSATARKSSGKTSRSSKRKTGKQGRGRAPLPPPRQPLDQPVN